MNKYLADRRDALRGTAVSKTMALQNSFEGLCSEGDDDDEVDENEDTTIDGNQAEACRKHRPNRRQRQRLKHWRAWNHVNAIEKEKDENGKIWSDARQTECDQQFHKPIDCTEGRQEITTETKRVRFTRSETCSCTQTNHDEDELVRDTIEPSGTCEEDWVGVRGCDATINVTQSLHNCYNHNPHDNHNSGAMCENIIIIIIIITTTIHDHNEHCNPLCGSSHPKRMLNCSGPQSPRGATVACSSNHCNCHAQSSQSAWNWSIHRSFGCIDHTSERVTLHEQQVDGDELLGLETLQDGSPTPKLIGHAGGGGSLTRGSPHSQMWIAGSEYRHVSDV